MKIRAFQQIDVFGSAPYLGNPLAVVLDGTDLTTEEMQHFAQWTNLSETTFLLPPSAQGASAGADYRVRIFTPGAELPFAGHPTLGSCHAWLTAGGKPDAEEIVQECAAGLIRIRRSGARFAFAAPPLRRSTPKPELLAKISTALGLSPKQIKAAQLLDNGPLWLAVLVDSRQTVLALTPDHQALKIAGQKVGVVAIEMAPGRSPLIARSNREARAFATTAIPSDIAADDSAEVEVRAFAAPVGVQEDPVTGSLNASLAQWLITDGLAPGAYIATQGACVGRAGQVHITQDETGQVWVGGDSVTCVEGSVNL
jgi:PhzF family phenazine biosynthesis protein